MASPRAAAPVMATSFTAPTAQGVIAPQTKNATPKRPLRMVTGVMAAESSAAAPVMATSFVAQMAQTFIFLRPKNATPTSPSSMVTGAMVADRHFGNHPAQTTVMKLRRLQLV